MNNETKKCPYCFEEIKTEAVKCKWCRSSLTPEVQTVNWYRDLPTRRFLGVASALGVNTGINVLAWRIMFIVLTLFHGIGLIAYLAVWLLTPFHQNGRSPMERSVRACRLGYETLRKDETGTKQS